MRTVRRLQIIGDEQVDNSRENNETYAVCFGWKDQEREGFSIPAQLKLLRQ